MKNNSRAFGSIEDWKTSLMNLPENSFFELLRSVFGNIKSPFSKQRLMEDLTTLLSKTEIQSNINSYIDERDHKIIAAIAILRNPGLEEIDSFFSGEFSTSELHTILLNLEERLILYRFRSEGIMRLSLNPVLEKILAPYAEDSSILFPSYPRESSPPRAFYLEGRYMAALLAFILSEDCLFKSSGRGAEIRRKVLNDGEKIFPGMDLELLVNTFLRLGIIRQESQKVVSDKNKISDYCKLSHDERQIYWAAAVYLYLEEDFNKKNTDGKSEQDRFGDILAKSKRNRLRRIAEFFSRYRNYIKADSQYPETTLRRLAEILVKDDVKPVWESLFFEEKLIIHFESFLTALEKTGFLGISYQDLEDTQPENKMPESGKAVIAMDTAFSFFVYPEISFSNALALTSFCNINESTVFNLPISGKGAEKAGMAAACFTISRESAVRGFDEGMNSASMLELLEKLSGNRLDPNLGWSLREWETRYTEVSLSQGVILTLAEDRRYLSEAEPMASMIQRCLAPGVYLLSSRDRSEAADALRKTGVDIIAQPPSQTQTGRPVFRKTANSFLSLPSYESYQLPSMENNVSADKQKDPGRKIDTLKQKFHKTLEKMNLSKPERDELSARIERRMVLSTTQLETSIVRYEKLEARGLDFAGKSSIAKQAAESNSMVEISWPGPRGEINRSTGIARALEKKGNDSILVIEESGLNGDLSQVSGKTIRIPLEKISLIRRIKQSIFGV